MEHIKPILERVMNNILNRNSKVEIVNKNRKAYLVDLSQQLFKQREQINKELDEVIEELVDL